MRLWPGVPVQKILETTLEMKKALGETQRRKHCALAVVTRSQKFSPRRRPPSRGRRTAKIKSAGDGHYLHLQTQFGEFRCMQFRVIMVTDTARPPAHPLQTRPQTGPITIHCAAKLSAQCNDVCLSGNSQAACNY